MLQLFLFCFHPSSAPDVFSVWWLEWLKNEVSKYSFTINLGKRIVVGFVYYFLSQSLLCDWWCSAAFLRRVLFNTLLHDLFWFPSLYFWCFSWGNWWLLTVKYGLKNKSEEILAASATCFMHLNSKNDCSVTVIFDFFNFWLQVY